MIYSKKLLRIIKLELVPEHIIFTGTHATNTKTSHTPDKITIITHNTYNSPAEYFYKHKRHQNNCKPPQSPPNTTGKPVIYLDLEYSKQHLLPLLLRTCNILLQYTKSVLANM